MEPIYENLKKKLRHLTKMWVGILASAPNTKQQQLHTDFSNSLFEEIGDPHLYPFSIIVPLHSSCTLRIGKFPPPDDGNNEGLQVHNVVVPYQYYVRFRGDVIHGGGENKSKQTTTHR